jgi:hypothetical protein
MRQRLHWQQNIRFSSCTFSYVSYRCNRVSGMLIDEAHSILSLETFTRDRVHSLILYRRSAIQPECHMIANDTNLVRLMISRPRGLELQIKHGGYSYVPLLLLGFGLAALTSSSNSKSARLRLRSESPLRARFLGLLVRDMYYHGTTNTKKADERRTS